MSESIHSILKSLPKADLHCHLDGSLRLETILDLAQIQNIALPCNSESSFERRYIWGITAKIWKTISKRLN